MDSVYRLSVVLGMIDNMTSPLSGVTDKVTDSTERINQAFGVMQKAGAALAGVGAGMVSAGLATVTSTFETQDALGELSSLGVKDLQAVEAAAKSFSDTWAGTTKSDFITAAYDIKSGIASLTDEGVADFTELAALTGKATKSTTEEMGSLFATGYGIYKGAYEDLSDLQFGEMFSSGIATAVRLYKTAGSEMASAISMLGATATNANVPLDEQLAILGQLQTTMSGSEAATKYRAFLNAAASAGEKLGISFVDANNQLLSTPEILGKLKDKYGDTMDAMEKLELKEAFGTDEAVAMIDLLYQDIDGLTGGIDELSQSMSKGVAVTREMAEAINSTPKQQFDVLKQKIHNNVEELGNGLLPAVNDTLVKVNALVGKGSEWISSNQETVQTIMNLSMKIGILLMVLGGAVTMINSVGKAVINVRTSIGALKSAWGVLSSAMLTTPAGLVILSIAALAAVFLVLWKRSDSFRAFWTEMFGKVKGTALAAWNELQPRFVQIGQRFQELYEAAKPILQVFRSIIEVVGIQMLGTIVGAITGIIAMVAPLADAFSAFLSFVTNVVNMIAALFRGDIAGAFDYAKAAVDDFADFFVKGFDAVLSFLNGFANGFLDVIGGLFALLGVDMQSGFAKIKQTVSGELTAVKGLFSSIMGAAAATVKIKLDNIRRAYETSGGGIRGIVAATQEAVKSSFTAGLTFIDQLTGGKLTAIREKFHSKLTAVANTAKSIIDKIKGFFNVDFPTPRLKMPHVNISGGFSLSPLSVPKFSVDWYAKGGVMTAPTIFGASGGNLLGGGEAGPEAILPLSVLWAKLKEFLHQETDGHDDTNRGSAASVLSTVIKRESRTVERSERSVSDWRKEQEPAEKRRGNTTIQKLEIKVDMSRIKDLQMLQRLIDELKDANGSPDDPVLA